MGSIPRSRLARRSESRVALVALVLFGFLFSLSHTDRWRHMEMVLFDTFSVFVRPADVDLPIVIVGIDDPSFAELRRQWPWPRELHATVIRTLKDAGAAVIAFDVLFAEPSDPSGDRLLADAIRSAGNVVLAADRIPQQGPLYRQIMDVYPWDTFVDAGARAGLANLVLDGDLVVRRIPSYPDSLWKRIVQTYRRAAPSPAPGATDGEGLIRYVGPPGTLRYVSYYQALSPAKFLPVDAFRDRIVLVGLAVPSSPEPGAAQPDHFATPFFRFTGRLMPGVEVHANAVANALTGGAVHEAPPSAVLALALVISMLAVLVLRRWHPLHSFLYGVCLTAAVTALSWWFFRFHSIWLPVALPVSLVATAYVAQGGIAFLEERRRRQQIRKAFEHYVPAQVVEEVAASPEKLVLGGERRKITIMFTDLEGFTGVSERLSPEQVARFLNRHHSAMTDIIHRHGGTVQKFLGDGIYAFWGAPLEDPEQALHAGQAALRLQEKNQELTLVPGESRDQGLAMRIGIHTGLAAVGNIGSEERFEYGAVGDSVNLASRLEGANKVYGTRILISGATAAEVADRLPVRRVDLVRVKGRIRPIELFTVTGQWPLNALNERAIAAYRERRWDLSLSLWSELISQVSGDQIAHLYIRRLTGFRSQPPGDDWDGSVLLEQK